VYVRRPDEDAADHTFVSFRSDVDDASGLLEHEPTVVHLVRDTDVDYADAVRPDGHPVTAFGPYRAVQAPAADLSLHDEEVDAVSVRRVPQHLGTQSHGQGAEQLELVAEARAPGR